MKDRVDLSARAISERLAAVARGLDLRPSQRLDSKVDLSAPAVSARFREVAELNRLCALLAGRAKRPE
jgi:hypothetical protein